MLTLRHLAPLENIFQDIFREADWAPALDFVETPDAYLVHVELPGVDPTTVELEIVEGRLEIRGEKTIGRKTEDHEWRRVERRQGKFRRYVGLPDDLATDNIEAEFEHGVLTVRLPRQEKAKARRIAIVTK